MEGGGEEERDERVHATLRRRRRREEDGGGPDHAGGKLHKPDSASESCLEELGDVRSEEEVHEVITFQPSTLSVRHYDPNTTAPVSYSLDSLEELLSWKRCQASPFNVATVTLATREPTLARTARRTLVSHDMMGGYLEDRFMQGAEVDTPYVFYHWEYIDIFNYFSHHMVTIPPAVWTNAAHHNGVLSLGTFITEWEDGVKVCEAFLAEEKEFGSVADKLVEIAECYGFDGWLINIENALSAAAVKNLVSFLQYLTQHIHQRLPGSLVIWYDSVLEDGSLKWQNELNDKNSVFFDACDGIFTNYNWTEDTLQHMVSYSAAQERLADIYVGIDVFGRGEVVGGMFETNKALELVRKYSLSTAIFAPGWVYECHDKADFLKNQDKFWGLLMAYLYVHRAASPLPFVSSFCQGFGRNLYWRGQMEQEGCWFNLSAQEIQPLYSDERLEGGGRFSTHGCRDDAWTGGSSLVLDGHIPSSLTKVCARLLSLHVPLASRTFISFTYKLSVGVNVALELKTTDAALCSYSSTEDVPSSSVYPVVLNEGHRLVKQFIQSCGQWNADGWTTRCFQLELSGCALREVCVNVAPDEKGRDVDFHCRIGEIMVLDAASLTLTPQPVHSVRVCDVVWHRGEGGGDDSSSLKILLSATLRWRYPTPVRHFRVHWRRLRGPDPRVPSGVRVLIGRAFCPLYRLVELEVPAAPGLLELLVEPVSREGFRVPEDYWGRQRLSYTGPAEDAVDVVDV